MAQPTPEDVMFAFKGALASMGAAYGEMPGGMVRAGFESLPYDYWLLAAANSLDPSLPTSMQITLAPEFTASPGRIVAMADLANRINSIILSGCWIVSQSGNVRFDIGLPLESLPSEDMLRFLIGLAMHEYQRAIPPMISVSEDGTSPEDAMVFFSV